MAMVFPRLCAEHYRITTVSTQKHMKKYNHFIKWRKNASILEIGHADGGNSKKSLVPYLPKDLKEFVATDISENMVKYAKNHAAFDSMKFAQLDIATQELPSEYLNRFDHIFGFYVMHMIREPRKAYENMFNMLRKGGSIFLTLCENTPFDETLDKLSKDPEWKKYGPENYLSPYFNSSDPRLDCERDLIEAGFKSHEIFEEFVSHEFLDEEEFDKTFLLSSALLPSIPEDEREKFLKLYLELTKNGKMISCYERDGENILVANHNMFIVVASKC